MNFRGNIKLALNRMRVVAQSWKLKTKAPVNFSLWNYKVKKKKLIKTKNSGTFKNTIAVGSRWMFHLLECASDRRTFYSILQLCQRRWLLGIEDCFSVSCVAGRISSFMLYVASSRVSNEFRFWREIFSSRVFFRKDWKDFFRLAFFYSFVVWDCFRRST